MEENLIEPTFQASKRESIIKVIGVGGAGCNAVQHMYKEGIVGVDFIVCNTDRQNIESNLVPTKLVIGESGLGAGADPQKAQKLAEQTEDKIRNLIGENTKMVFITAGMGKGTGTGASPVVARIAREMGILTIGVVTYPWRLEQKPARVRADEGIAELKKYVDSLIIIKNQKIMEEYSSVKLSVALGFADDVLKNAVKCIAELITVEGYQNVDYSDVESVMKDSGEAMIALAEASGDNRAEEVVRQAMTCPLLDDVNITDAQKFLFFLRYGADNEPTIGELEQIETEFRSYVSEDTHVIFGHAVDKNLGDKIRLSVVITNYSKKKGKETQLDDNNHRNNNLADENCSPFEQPKNEASAAENVKTIEIPDVNAIITPQYKAPEPVFPEADLFDTHNEQSDDSIKSTEEDKGVHCIDEGKNIIYDNDNAFTKFVSTPAYARQSEQPQPDSARLMEVQTAARKLPQPNYTPSAENLIFGNLMAD